MSSRVEILAAALQLPEEDRLSIAARLMEILPDETLGPMADEPYFAELERRSNDAANVVDWSELRKELREPLQGRSASMVAPGKNCAMRRDGIMTMMSARQSGF